MDMIFWIVATVVVVGVILTLIIIWLLSRLAGAFDGILGVFIDFDRKQATGDDDDD